MNQLMTWIANTSFVWIMDDIEGQIKQQASINKINNKELHFTLNKVIKINTQQYNQVIKYLIT